MKEEFGFGSESAREHWEMMQIAKKIQEKAARKLKIKCCICGVRIVKHPLDNHNPYPVRSYSHFGETENRCCGMCNERYVKPIRVLVSAAEQNEHFTEEEIEEFIDSCQHMDCEDLDYLLKRAKQDFNALRALKMLIEDSTTK